MIVPAFEVINPKQPLAAANQGVIYPLRFLAEEDVYIATLFQIDTRFQAGMAQRGDTGVRGREYFCDSLV